MSAQRTSVEMSGFTGGVAATAAVDPLTGLYTRSLLADIAEARLSEARRHGYQASVVRGDLDGWEGLAESYGQGTRVAVLRSVAELLRTCLRREDLVGRMDDEGFVILMLHCDGENAFAKADALRDAIAQMEPEGVPVTASFGVTSAFMKDTVDFDAMCHWAGHAMSAAREAGGNRIVVHVPEQAASLANAA